MYGSSGVLGRRPVGGQTLTRELMKEDPIRNGKLQDGCSTYHMNSYRRPVTHMVTIELRLS